MQTEPISKITNEKKDYLHCKYIRPDYDGTLAIHRSGTMIPCRDQLQCKIWEFPIQDSITQDQQEGQNTIFEIVKIPAIGCRMSIKIHSTYYDI